MTLKHRSLALAAPLLVLAGCAPQAIPYRPALEREAELHLYLQPLPQEAQRLKLHMAQISAVRSDGAELPLLLAFPELNGRDLASAQKRLASATLPPGSYRGVSILLDAASLVREEGTAALLVPDEPIQVAQDFTLASKKANALFLSLAPANLVTGGFRFTPSFSLQKSRRELRNLLGFATSSGANLVTVFNKHSMQVVDVIATGSGPRGGVIDPRRGWVYIALAGDNAIEAIEVNTGEILRRLQMNFGDEPNELALSFDGQLLASANSGSNTASVIDAGSLREIDRVTLSSEPTSVVTHPSSARAFLFQPLAHTISQVDLARIDVARTQIFDEMPFRGAMSKDGNTLYAITRYSSDLLVIDATTLNLLERIYIGPGAASIAVDLRTELVYVGKKGGSISVVDPGSLASIDDLSIPGDVVFMDLDLDENSLIVATPNLNAVQKIDLTNKSLRGVLDVGDGGYAVVLMNPR